ncbi:MAG: hypothetical protein QOI06_246 [Nocardioidaceae bacterium]|jgi:hypothetical protein|nr:hypothetical protein [Nocardioidaceae bacterium]
MTCKVELVATELADVTDSDERAHAGGPPRQFWVAITAVELRMRFAPFFEFVIQKANVFSVSKA